MEAMGFPWYSVPFSRGGLNPLSELGSIRKIQALYSAIRPDLVHHFTLQSVAWGTVAARRSGVPRIVNALAGLGSLFRGGSIKGRLLKFPVNSLLGALLKTPGSRTIFQNPDDLGVASRYWRLDPGNVALIRGSGVDIARFSPVERTLASPQILYIGRLLKDKGILDFIRMANQLSSFHPAWRFTVAGTVDPGNPSSLTNDEVARVSAANPNLNFLGHVEDMPSLLATTHLCVLPSQYGEGVPRSLIEAAAAGIPLVAYDSTGCREIVRPGVNGNLAPPGDVEALTSAVKMLLCDPNVWREYGIMSRRIAEEEFSSSLVFDRTLGIYSQLGMPILN
jgi:glycosyltransferase involved in cell wall biosynthesis